MDTQAEIDTTPARIDLAGMPIQGDLKARAVARGHKMMYWADQLKPRGHNPRDWSLRRNKNKVIEFAQSIHDGGIRATITVYKEGDDILIEHGETRWLAVRLLEGTDDRGVLIGVTDSKILRLFGSHPKNDIRIPAVVGPKRNEFDRLTDTVVHNTGNQFADIEYARIIKRYMDWGKTQVEIADLLGGEAAGWTQTRVSHIHQLNFASPTLQRLLGEEVILTTTVVAAMRDYEDKAEEYILAAIDDAKKKAAEEAAVAEAEARTAQDEVRRTREEAGRSLVVPEGGGRKVPKLEAAQRKATAASDRATRSRQVAQAGPQRITARDVAGAVARRDPKARVNPQLSKAGIIAFLDALRFEAQYSHDPATRERMNGVLKRYGFVEMPTRVDDAETSAVTTVAA